MRVLALALGEDGAADVWDARAVWVEVDERSGETVAGTILESEFDGDGYREGDRLSMPLDRVFDIWLPGADGAGVFNERRARFALGKRVLAGVTVLSEDAEEVLERRAFAATVASVVPGRGIDCGSTTGRATGCRPTRTRCRRRHRASTSCMGRARRWSIPDTSRPGPSGTADSIPSSRPATDSPLRPSRRRVTPAHGPAALHSRPHAPAVSQGARRQSR